MKYIMICIVGAIVLSGCSGTVNESVRGVTEPVGTVLAVPQSMSQGVATGYVDQTGTTQSNPYGR